MLLGGLVAQAPAPIQKLLADSGKGMFRVETRRDIQQIRSLPASQTWVSTLQVGQSGVRAEWQVSLSILALIPIS